MLGSDIYIMIPVKYNNYSEIKFTCCQEDIECNEFYDSLNRQINYACKETVKNTINKTNCLGDIKLKYYTDDNYDNYGDLYNYMWLDCYAYLRINESTKLGILEIILKQFKLEDSLVGGTVLGDHAIIKSSNYSNGAEFTLKEFIKELGLENAGDYRILYQNKFVDDLSQLKYLLSGETKSREKDTFNIKDDFFGDNFNDIVDYDEFQFYASDKAIITLIKDFKDDFRSNIDFEIMPFYIIEFSILQNAAINRMNARTTEALRNDGKLSLKDSLSIIEEFGKTIFLWDKNIYKYYFDQKSADELYKAFKTDMLWNEYERNKAHLDQLTNIKDSINGNRESFILGAISFLFTLINLYELIISFKDKSMTPNSLTFSFTIIYLIWVVYLLHKNRT